MLPLLTPLTAVRGSTGGNGRETTTPEFGLEAAKAPRELSARSCAAETCSGILNVDGGAAMRLAAAIVLDDGRGVGAGGVVLFKSLPPIPAKPDTGVAALIGASRLGTVGLASMVPGFIAPGDLSGGPS